MSKWKDIALDLCPLGVKVCYLELDRLHRKSQKKAERTKWKKKNKERVRASNYRRTYGKYAESAVILNQIDKEISECRKNQKL